MAENRSCDHCGQPMNAYDAGEVPVVMKHPTSGIELVVRVVSRDGVFPNVRPECLKTMMAEAELLYPPRRAAVNVGRVVDAGAAESEDDKRLVPAPA